MELSILPFNIFIFLQIGFQSSGPPDNPSPPPINNEFVQVKVEKNFEVGNHTLMAFFINIKHS